MNHKAITWSVLLLLVVAMGTVIQCRKNTEIIPPPSIIGEYVGTYNLVKTEGSATLLDTTNLVEARFTQTDYSIDPTVSVDLGSYFCHSNGKYSLEDGVVFKELDGNVDREVCTEADNPSGFFGLIMNTGTDTIIVKQDIVDSLGIRSIKTLKLVLEN